MLLVNSTFGKHRFRAICVVNTQEMTVSIFCSKNCPVCCNHCKHFLDDLDVDYEDDFSGTCTLFGTRVYFDNECFDFFCRAAAESGTGYLGQSTHWCDGPFVLNDEFFNKHAKSGWCFRKEDIRKTSPSNGDAEEA